MTIGREMPYRRRKPAASRTGSLVLDRHLAETVGEQLDSEAARDELKLEREAKKHMG